MIVFDKLFEDDYESYFSHIISKYNQSKDPLILKEILEIGLKIDFNDFPRGFRYLRLLSEFKKCNGEGFFDELRDYSKESYHKMTSKYLPYALNMSEDTTKV